MLDNISSIDLFLLLIVNFNYTSRFNVELTFVPPGEVETESTRTLCHCWWTEDRPEQTRPLLTSCGLIGGVFTNASFNFIIIFSSASV